MDRADSSPTPCPSTKPPRSSPPTASGWRESSEDPGRIKPSPGSGTHTEKGRQTLAEILVYATNHLDHHLKFLYAKRAKLGVAIYPRYTANSGV